MKFIIDMPLSPELGQWLNSKGHDAIHASKVGLDRASDEVILEKGRTEKRIVITADLDYARILALTGAAEPGLVLFRGGNYNDRQAIDRLDRALEVIPENDFENSMIVIDKSRIRRRSLPIQQTE